MADFHCAFQGIYRREDMAFYMEWGVGPIYRPYLIAYYLFEHRKCRAMKKELTIPERLRFYQCKRLQVRGCPRAPKKHESGPMGCIGHRL